VEWMYEYGSRAGFWRLWRMFTERKLPVTVFAVASALPRNPETVVSICDSQHQSFTLKQSPWLPSSPD